jgi:phage anti-repressor protein
MEELIKFRKHEENEVVLAKDLFNFLELNTCDWDDWKKENITNNTFVFELWDWWNYETIINDICERDFLITIDFAKRISMQTKNKKGEQIRDYFIKAEKKLQEVKNAVSEFEFLTIDQVLYIIDLINCFKFITHQKAVENQHKDTHISSSKNISIKKAAIDFHLWRNAALELDKDTLNERLLRYYNEDHQYCKDKLTKREILYIIDKYGLIKIAVFDFLKGVAIRPDATALKVGEIAQKLAERLNVEIRLENKPDLFHEEIEEVNRKMLHSISSYLPENKSKRLK